MSTNFLKKLIIMVFKKMRQRSYPYVYKARFAGNRYSFYVNSSVEEFRTRRWGGEKSFLRKLISALEPQDTFYDIGAAIGLVSIVASSKHTKGEVIAIEPDLNIFNRLKKNVELNNLCNCRLLQLALGEKSQQTTLYTKGADSFSPSLRPVQGFETKIRVQQKKLDDLVFKEGYPMPSVVKIDVEGAELKVLRGMEEIFKFEEARPRLIFVEIHKSFLPLFGDRFEDVIKLLRNYKYEYSKIFDRGDQAMYFFTDRM